MGERLPVAAESGGAGEIVNLVGSKEIQELLGVSRQRVDQLSKSPGFPSPVASLASGRIWLRADIERWAKGPKEPTEEECRKLLCDCHETVINKWLKIRGCRRIKVAS